MVDGGDRAKEGNTTAAGSSWQQLAAVGSRRVRKAGLERGIKVPHVRFE